MNEKFDIGKLIRGFAFWKGEVFGKIIFVVIIACIICGVFYVLFVRPTQRTTQKAQTITNITEVKEEAAFELQVIPPKIKIGGCRFKLFK